MFLIILQVIPKLGHVNSARLPDPELYEGEGAGPRGPGALVLLDVQLGLNGLLEQAQVGVQRNRATGIGFVNTKSKKIKYPKSLG